MNYHKTEENKIRKLSAYYKPYMGLFLADLFFAMLSAAISLVIPLLVRYIMNHVGSVEISQAKEMIFQIGGLMILLVLLHTETHLKYHTKNRQ